MSPLIIILAIALVITLIYVMPKTYRAYSKKREEKLKREITQNISHELKTPLASILGYIESIMAHEDLPEEKMRYFIERTHHQAKRLQNLLDDISVLNKLDEKKNSVYNFESVSISDVLSEVMDDVRQDIEAKGIDVDVSLPESCSILGNRSLVYSIFRNLFDNAIAYAGENISIRVCLEEDDRRYLHFSFADSGVGIEKQHQARIFERFYRVEKGRSRKSGGTGLGLAIVKNAVSLHHGVISVESNQPQGTRFLFTLRKS